MVNIIITLLRIIIMIKRYEKLTFCSGVTAGVWKPLLQFLIVIITAIIIVIITIIIIVTIAIIIIVIITIIISVIIIITASPGRLSTSTTSSSSLGKG